MSKLGGVCLLVVFGAAHSCVSNEECSLLGRCEQSKCICFDGWTGEGCSVADLAPLDITLGYQNETSASWGGRPIKDPKTGTWQLMATEIANKCPLILFEYNSQVVRAVSKTGAGGPYIRAETVLPPFHHNPTFVGPTPDGYYLLFFIGADNLTNTVDCSNGIPSDIPLPSWGNNSRQDVISNQYISMAWSKDIVNGPWKQRVILRHNFPTDNQTAWNCQVCNPSAHILANGTIVLNYRANPCLGPDGEKTKGATEDLGIAVAPHWSADFVRDPGPVISPATSRGQSNEDAFLWQQPDGTWHMVNHNQGQNNICGSKEAGDSCGAHWFAHDAHGPWRMSVEPVYTSNVLLANGSDARFLTRQRPQLVFSEDGLYKPIYLFTSGSFDGTNRDMSCFSHTYAHGFKNKSRGE